MSLGSKVQTPFAGDLGPEEGCPRCGGRVHAAEGVAAAGATFHRPVFVSVFLSVFVSVLPICIKLMMCSDRSCHSCAWCSKPIEVGQGCDGPDREVYCNQCHARSCSTAMSTHATFDLFNILRESFLFVHSHKDISGCILHWASPKQLKIWKT